MRRAAQLLAVLCVVALVATLAVAGGKKPPGGDDPSTGGGMIYFSYAGQVCTMNSDGSAKTPLPIGASGHHEMIEPSRQLHDGQRWFLQMRELDPSAGTYPDGGPLLELFAISEDGLTTVQLTSDDPGDGSVLEPLHTSTWRTAMPGAKPRWTFDDTKVSWTARLWIYDELSGDWYVDQDGAGIYSLDITFVDGAPVPPPAGPVLLVEAELVHVEGAWYPELGMHDWSPDGTCIVYDHWNSGFHSSPIYIVDLSTGASQYLTEGYDPQWSPDGAAIAFVSKYFGFPEGGVETINIDGSDRKIVFADTEHRMKGPQSQWHYLPSWSPTGSHLSCYRQTFDTHASLYFGDVLRAQADGGRQTNLTRDLDTKKLEVYAILIGWR
jgi:hypothetical protein